MSVLVSALNSFNRSRVGQIECAMKNPYDTQNEILHTLIDKAKDTEWGKVYGYSEIRNVYDFKRNVPLQDYESVKVHIARIQKGEKNILWPGSIRWFAKSSGTTNDKSKYIPVSTEALQDCHYRGGRDMIAYYSVQNPATRIFGGKVLTLGGSHKLDNYCSLTYNGDLSSILIHNLPVWAQWFRTPRKEIALLDKWEEKLEKLTKSSIKEDVRVMAGVPSWTMVLCKYILDYTGKSNMLEVWPNLELFIHGGVSFLPYQEQFNRLIPSEKMNYMETYNASEGFFAYQNDLKKDDMLLALDLGVFYEFIPLEYINDKNPETLTIDQVKTDVQYAIVITTNTGLWRYIIGDTIAFKSLYPHKIKVTGRTKHFINVFGEEVIADNAEKALKKACDYTNAEITDYTVAPVFMNQNSKGAHEWFIEFGQQPNNLKLFVDKLDKALMDVNSDYEAKRYNNMTLEKPHLTILKKNVFYFWLEKKGKLGGQNKIPRLSNTRDFAMELMQINNSM